MTAKELKEALANVPDDAEVYMDDGCSVNAIPTKTLSDPIHRRLPFEGDGDL